MGGVFLNHLYASNLEEIRTIERWFQTTYLRVSKKIPSVIQKELNDYKDISSAQFSVVIFVFSVFNSALIWIAVLLQHDYLFLGVKFFLLLIYLVTHYNLYI